MSGRPSYSACRIVFWSATNNCSTSVHKQKCPIFFYSGEIHDFNSIPFHLFWCIGDGNSNFAGKNLFSSRATHDVVFLASKPFRICVFENLDKRVCILPPICAMIVWRFRLIKQDWFDVSLPSIAGHRPCQRATRLVLLSGPGENKRVFENVRCSAITRKIPQYGRDHHTGVLAENEQRAF